MKTLTHEALFQQAPSIFSAEAHEKVSDKYAMIPTIECVKGLEKAGYYPVSAKESRSRDAQNRPFAKHMIRFRKHDHIELGGNVPEIVLFNSHNGLSSYQLKAGIYRLVCANGLIVGNDMFHSRVKHQGNAVEKVIEAADHIIEIMPKAIEVAGEWRDIRLTTEQKRAFAESASLLKWSPEEIEISPERLLLPRRLTDQSNDLWTTFNVIQENMIKGGMRYYKPDSFKRGTTRKVESVQENSRLNTALWNLTEKMAELVKVA
jgi:hypothetical protein